MLGGAVSRATGGFGMGVEFVLVEAAEAADKRLFSAIAKTSSLPFGLDVDPAEEVVAEEDLEASIRDRTDSTEFLF